MIDGKKVIVVMPAYNAAETLAKTVAEVPREVVDEIIVVDDASSDLTSERAAELGLTTFRHTQNFGYGRNQKTCYAEALRRGADIVVMVHPDYQYSPKLIMAMASMIAYGTYDTVIGSRILGTGAIAGGMPIYKFISNRFLTLAQNILMSSKLSEYHTGFRAFSRKVLESLPLDANSDDFVFDNQMLAQSVYFGFSIGEVSCPTRYTAESSSINFRRSVRYGFGVLATSLSYRLNKIGILRSQIFAGSRSEDPGDYYHEVTDPSLLRSESVSGGPRKIN